MILSPVSAERGHGAVLVVEDEALIRLSVVDALADAGLSVLEAENATEALALLRTHATDIRALFTDIHMPGPMNGLDLVHLARRHWPWIAVLVASGQARLGPDDLPPGARFLPKPYNEERVIAHIRQAAHA